MEAILAKINYSKPSHVTTERITIPAGDVVEINLSKRHTVTLDHTSKPTCRWTLSGKTGASLPDWKNEQIHVPQGNASATVLTVYRDAVETQHSDH